MGRKLKDKGHCPSIYFQLFDESKWEMIDRLMTLPKYEKSRTALINNALDYGLPKLVEQEFGEVRLTEEPQEEQTYNVPMTPTVVQTIDDESIVEIVRLLNEIVINTSITKSIASGMFNEKIEELKKDPALAERMKKGLFNSTPDCLFAKEIRMLKEMNKDEDEE